MSKKYLTTFFQEKQLPFESWELTDSTGVAHFIDTDVVKEHIFATSPQEITQISNIIRQIDFKNGNVNHFLRHLAQGLVENYSSKVSQL